MSTMLQHSKKFSRVVGVKMNGNNGAAFKESMITVNKKFGQPGEDLMAGLPKRTFDPLTETTMRLVSKTVVGPDGIPMRIDYDREWIPAVDDKWLQAENDKLEKKRAEYEDKARLLVMYLREHMTEGFKAMLENNEQNFAKFQRAYQDNDFRTMYDLMLAVCDHEQKKNKSEMRTSWQEITPGKGEPAEIYLQRFHRAAKEVSAAEGKELSDTDMAEQLWKSLDHREWDKLIPYVAKKAEGNPITYLQLKQHILAFKDIRYLDGSFIPEKEQMKRRAQAVGQFAKPQLVEEEFITTESKRTKKSAKRKSRNEARSDSDDEAAGGQVFYAAQEKPQRKKQKPANQTPKSCPLCGSSKHDSLHCDTPKEDRKKCGVPGCNYRHQTEYHDYCQEIFKDIGTGSKSKFSKSPGKKYKRDGGGKSKAKDNAPVKYVSTKTADETILDACSGGAKVFMVRVTKGRAVTVEPKQTAKATAKPKVKATDKKVIAAVKKRLEDAEQSAPRTIIELGSESENEEDVLGTPANLARAQSKLDSKKSYVEAVNPVRKYIPLRVQPTEMVQLTTQSAAGEVEIISVPSPTKDPAECDPKIEEMDIIPHLMVVNKTNPAKWEKDAEGAYALYNAEDGSKHKLHLRYHDQTMSSPKLSYARHTYVQKKGSKVWEPYLNYEIEQTIEGIDIMTPVIYAERALGQEQVTKATSQDNVDATYAKYHAYAEKRGGTVANNSVLVRILDPAGVLFSAAKVEVSKRGVKSTAKATTSTTAAARTSTRAAAATSKAPAPITPKGQGTTAGKGAGERREDSDSEGDKQEDKGSESDSSSSSSSSSSSTGTSSPEGEGSGSQSEGGELFGPESEDDARSGTEKSSEDGSPELESEPDMEMVEVPSKSRPNTAEPSGKGKNRAKDGTQELQTALAKVASAKKQKHSRSTFLQDDSDSESEMASTAKTPKRRKSAQKGSRTMSKNESDSDPDDSGGSQLEVPPAKKSRMKWKPDITAAVVKNVVYSDWNCDESEEDQDRNPARQDLVDKVARCWTETVEEPEKDSSVHHRRRHQPKLGQELNDNSKPGRGIDDARAVLPTSFEDYDKNLHEPIEDHQSADELPDVTPHDMYLSSYQLSLLTQRQMQLTYTYALDMMMTLLDIDPTDRNGMARAMLRSKDSERKRANIVDMRDNVVGLYRALEECLPKKDRKAFKALLNLTPQLISPLTAPVPPHLTTVAEKLKYSQDRVLRIQAALNKARLEKNSPTVKLSNKELAAAQEDVFATRRVRRQLAKEAAERREREERQEQLRLEEERAEREREERQRQAEQQRHSHTKPAAISTDPYSFESLEKVTDRKVLAKLIKKAPTLSAKKLAKERMVELLTDSDDSDKSDGRGTRSEGRIGSRSEAHAAPARQAATKAQGKDPSERLSEAQLASAAARVPEQGSSNQPPPIEVRAIRVPLSTLSMLKVQVGSVTVSKNRVIGNQGPKQMMLPAIRPMGVPKQPLKLEFIKNTLEGMAEQQGEESDEEEQLVCVSTWFESDLQVAVSADPLRKILLIDSPATSANVYVVHVSEFADSDDDLINIDSGSGVHVEPRRVKDFVPDSNPRRKFTMTLADGSRVPAQEIGKIAGIGNTVVFPSAAQPLASVTELTKQGTHVLFSDSHVYIMGPDGEVLVTGERSTSGEYLVRRGDLNGLKTLTLTAKSGRVSDRDPKCKGSSDRDPKPKQKPRRGARNRNKASVATTRVTAAVTVDELHDDDDDDVPDLNDHSDEDDAMEQEPEGARTPSQAKGRLNQSPSDQNPKGTSRDRMDLPPSAEKLEAVRQARYMHVALHHPSKDALISSMKNGLILGTHLSPQDVEDADRLLGPCHSCLVGKMRRAPEGPPKMEPASRIGEKVYVDIYILSEQSSDLSIGGYNHMLFSVDAYSGMVHAIRLTNKRSNECRKAFYYLEAEYKKHGHTISEIHVDSESNLKSCHAYLGMQGIKLKAAPDGLHNRRVERYVQTVKARVEAIRAHCAVILPPYLNGELVKTAVDSVNSFPNTQHPTQTPAMMFIGKKLDLNGTPLLPFGTFAVAKRGKIGQIVMVLGKSPLSDGALNCLQLRKERIVSRKQLQALKVIPEWLPKKFQLKEGANTLKTIRPLAYRPKRQNSPTDNYNAHSAAMQIMTPLVVRTKDLEHVPKSDGDETEWSYVGELDSQPPREGENDYQDVSDISSDSGKAPGRKMTKYSDRRGTDSSDGSQSEFPSSPVHKGIGSRSEIKPWDTPYRMDVSDKGRGGGKSTHKVVSAETLTAMSNAQQSRRKKAAEKAKLLAQAVAGQNAESSSDDSVHTRLDKPKSRKKAPPPTKTPALRKLLQKKKAEVVESDGEPGSGIEADPRPHRTRSEVGRTDKYPRTPDNTEGLRRTTRPHKPKVYRVEGTLEELKASINRISVKAALKSDRAQETVEAIRNEIQNMLHYQVGHYVRRNDIPQEKRGNIIDCFMFIKHKETPDGQYDKTKARLVGNGKNQKPHMYDLTHSSTVSLASVFLLFNIASYYKCKMSSFDIKGAFLHAKLEEADPDTYLRIPKEIAAIWVDMDPEAAQYLQFDGSLVLQLDKFIYGLKQSPLKFQLLLVSVLINAGYTRLVNDGCVFVKRVRNDFSILSTHVDDVLQVYTSDELHEELKRVLSEAFAGVEGLTVHENAESYIGMSIQRSKCRGYIKLTQKGLCDKVAAFFPEEKGDRKRYSRPYDKEVFKTATGDEATMLSEAERISFLSVLMTMMFLARLTRPDILMVVTYLASRSHCATVKDMNSIKRVSRYLAHTPDLGIVIHCSELTIVCRSDASFGLHDGRGHTGYIVGMGTNLSYLHARSAKQKVGSTSSTEAEVIALAEAL
jgi:hypothetical protein